MTDTWADLTPLPPSTSTSTTPLSSPSRASRSKGITNDIPHQAFLRIHSTTTAIPLRFTIGDAVIVGPTAVLRQEWLGTPDHVLRTKGGKPKRGGGAKRVPAVQQVEGWKVDDGLGVNEKVGIIVGLYEDAQGKMMAKMRWFARPGAVWGNQGPEEGEEVDDFELYYTSDSTYLAELRARQDWTPGSLSRPSTATRTPLCTDPVPLSTITSHAQILTPSDPAPASPSSRGRGTIPSFLVRKVYDAKPVSGAEFLGEIDWLDVFRRGMEQGDWDVEAILEDEENEEEELVVSVAGKGKGKASARKVAKGKMPQVKRTKSYAESASGSSEEEDEDEEETFNPKSDGEESDHSQPDEAERHSSSSHDSASEADDPPTITTPSKRKRKPVTHSPSKRTSATPMRRVRPKLTAASKSRAGVIARKRTDYRKKREGQEALDSIPPTFTADAAFQKLSPFKQAQALLHVSATPEFLPCREEQRERIGSLLSDAILAQSGTCLYIHGVPGTGKTATVHSVVRELQNDPDIDSFQFVEINGMKIAEPNTAFSLLWEAVSGGQKAAPRVALTQLEGHFGTPSPARKTTVVLVDELDQMITKKQDVVYNFFNWPHVPHSRLIVIAIANTMDLPERELSGKIRSRLGSNRIVFTPYKWDELNCILLARLEGLHDQVFGTKAVEHIAKRVAGGAGDARRALDIARRTVEKVDQENQSSDGPPRLCTISDASATYREMTDYGANAFLRGTSLQEKVFLLSLAQCVKRRGVQEVEVDEVIDYHLKFLSQTSLSPTPPAHTSLLTLVASLHAQRLIATDSQRGDYFQRVRMLVGVGEVWEVLREDGELKGWVPRA